MKRFGLETLKGLRVAEARASAEDRFGSMHIKSALADVPLEGRDGFQRFRLVPDRRPAGEPR